MIKIVLDDGREIQLSKETEQRLKQELDKPELRVPENIKFETYCGDGDEDELGIVFNNDKQVLCATRYDSNTFIYKVWTAHKGYFLQKQPLLVLTPKEELEHYAGHTFFLSTGENTAHGLDILENYGKYLGQGEWAFVRVNKNITVDTILPNVQCYRVVVD